MSSVDIGALAGRVEFEDKVTSTMEIISQKIAGLETRFGGLDNTVKHTAEGFALAELAMKGIEKGIEIVTDVIKDFTIEGAQIGEVEKNFARLTQGAGRLSSTLMNELRSGTRGTITDFELMKDANDALAVGVNVTDAQYRSLATGAFALAQSKGIAVKDAFELINSAMVTGQARMLRQLDIRIDQTKAEEDYAASMDTTVEHLTAEGKIQATRAAILDTVTAATKRLGEQTDGLDEIVGQAQTAFSNFYEDLIKTAAASPNVIRAFTTVRDTLVTAFGGDSSALLETFVGWINTLADAVTEYAPSVIHGFESIRDFIVSFYHGAVEAWDTYGPVIIGGLTTLKGWLLDVYHQVVDTWDALPDWLKTVAERTALTTAGMVVLGAGAEAASSTIGDLVGAAGNLTTTFSGLPAAITNIGAGLGSLRLLAGLTALDFTSMGAASASLSLLGGSVVAMIGPLGVAAAAAAAMYAAFELGKWQPVSDFFQKWTLVIEGYSRAEADSMVATDHATQAALEQTKVKEQNNDVSEQMKAVTEQLKTAMHGAAGATEEHAEAGKKDVLVMSQTKEEMTKLKAEADKFAEAWKDLMVMGKNAKEILASIPVEVNANARAYLAAGAAIEKVQIAFRLTDEQAKALNDDFKEGKTKADDLKEALQHISEAGADQDKVLNGIGDRVMDDVQRYAALGVSVKDLALAYHLTEAQIRAVVDARNSDKVATDAQSAAYDKQNQVITSAAAAWVAMGDSAGGTLDDTHIKVRMLSGEVVSLKEAVDRFNMGSSMTYDLSSSAGIANYKQLNPAASFNWTETSIMDFVKKGGNLQQLIQQGAINPYARMGNGWGMGTLPSFAEGGTGDFGSGTLAILHGKEAIVPLDRAGTPIQITQYINGTAADVARKVSEEIMRTLKQQRQLGAA